MATMEETVTYQTLAEMFETRKRDDGTSFVALKDGAPEWASDFVREAHGTDMLPDDFRYACIAEALEMLADNEDGDPDDLVSEFADNVDIYSSDLSDWLLSHSERRGYVDEAQREGLVEPDTDIDRRIMAGQYLERSEIFQSVVSAAQDYLDEEE